jgi:hypothetical protein
MNFLSLRFPLASENLQHPLWDLTGHSRMNVLSLQRLDMTMACFSARQEKELDFERVSKTQAYR